MDTSKRELSSYFENMSLLVVGVFLLLFPLLFLSVTTDAFVLPKQIALSLATSLFVILFGIKTILDGRLKLRNSPFHLPVFLFILVVLLSAIFSLNRFDALTSFVPLLFVSILYFGIINVVKGEKQLLFILSSLVLGAVLSSLLSIFSYFKIFLLPFPYTHSQFFSTFGFLLDQAVYLALVLPIAGYYTYTLIAGSQTVHRRSLFSPLHQKSVKRVSGTTVLFSFAFVIIAVSLALTVSMLLTSQKPLILPFEIGLQTAFAAISQDTGQVFKGFILGSGIGTYLTDFTRYKPAAYNLNPTLWAFTFFRSSSFLLELLATTGLLGIAAFFFLIYRIFRAGNFFLPVILAIVAALLLPFSFTLVALFFILLGIFEAILVLNNPEKYSEFDYYLVALKRGLFVASPKKDRLPLSDKEKRYSKFLPSMFFLFLLLIAGVPLYFTMRFFMSDLTFQKSLIAASQNNGLQTYNLQVASINTFPYRDIYYRSFSQTNLALANALARNQQKDSSPSAQTQQQIVQLIQQGITAARNATTVSPLTSFNWNNLSTVYRSLIGFGQNADRFTLLTLQQAIALDPNNPQQYVDFGGVYYQLGQYDEAIRQFQIAINLKNDYANAYYNLGHALESKGELQGAFNAYEIVKTLVEKDAENSKKVAADIDNLKEKIGQQANPNPSKKVKASDEEQQPLGINQPSRSLPERNPRVKIQAPKVTPLPAKKAEPTPSL